MFLGIVHNPRMRLSQPPSLSLDWRHPYAGVDHPWHVPVAAQSLSSLHWVATNPSLAEALGWPVNDCFDDNLRQVLGGQTLSPGSQPHATVYSGHQFGVWAGQLGDGRALSLGLIDSPMGPQELQLKGAGKTPFSRMGDGRAVLRSSIREFLCSEAMHGLGIPTTRALCVVGSPDPVLRETVETAAVVTRVAPSFLRFGHLEHFAARGDTPTLRALVDHVIEKHRPHLLPIEAGVSRDLAFLEDVVHHTARLLAQWQSVGFCHGVMNTDNMSLLGLTLDYGPFQFLDGFDPAHICNHSDHQGRYAYARQPAIAHWNLHALGQAMLPLVQDTDAVLDILSGFGPLYTAQLDLAFARKLGLSSVQPDDHVLIQNLLTCLAKEKTDFTIFWRRLSLAVAEYAQNPSESAFQWVGDVFIDPTHWASWLAGYRQRLQGEDLSTSALQMRRTNPTFVLRNYLGEQAIAKAKTGDFTMVQDLLTVLQNPFDEHPSLAHFAAFPPDWASSIAISCSS